MIFFSSLFQIISIHALRVEGDFIDFLIILWYNYFYPRPPGGGRHKDTKLKQSKRRFLSTPSGWRATRLQATNTQCLAISIHALRVEGDGLHISSNEKPFGFLSTPSGWRATAFAVQEEGEKIFLSTPSGWRATDYVRF